MKKHFLYFIAEIIHKSEVRERLQDDAADDDDDGDENN